MQNSELHKKIYFTTEIVNIGMKEIAKNTQTHSHTKHVSELEIN